MKSIDLWDESDLLHLITDAVEENLKLDYKRSDSLQKDSTRKSELAKDVSAFANSAGGRLIYGIAERNNIPEYIDEGVDPSITREWIEQVINSRISPRISGLIIKPIILSTGRYAYIIEVPQSNTLSPHQSDDKEYYKRFNFQSVPMEDYEIRDVFRRGSVGHPVIYFSTLNIERDAAGVSTIKLNAIITNRSPEPILYCSYTIYIDSRMIDATTIVPTELNANGVVGTNGTVSGGVPIEVAQFSKNHGVPGSMPLYKEIVYTIGDFTGLRVASDGTYLIGYKVSCPGFSFSGLGHVIIDLGRIEGVPEQLDMLNPDRL